MARAALLALVAAVSVGAALGCDRLMSEYTVENGVVTVRVENSCSLNGFAFNVYCCGMSGCAPAIMERNDLALGPNGRAYATSGKDYIYVDGAKVVAGSRIKDQPKVALFYPESCKTPVEGDASVPDCQFPQVNFQTLVTITNPQCPNPSDVISVSGVANMEEVVDLATSRATVVNM